MSLYACGVGFPDRRSTCSLLCLRRNGVAATDTRGLIQPDTDGPWVIGCIVASPDGNRSQLLGR